MGEEEIILFKDDGNLAAMGEVGEICFKNEYMRGYYNLSEKTKEIFRNGYFCTGDMASKDQDGNITLHGRSDDMVKINGYRVEPGEIEAVARKVLGIQWTASKCFINPERSFICLYYIDDIDIDCEKARTAMSEFLPYYMLPSYFIHISSIPYNSTGKMDRKSLPEPGHDPNVTG